MRIKSGRANASAAASKAQAAKKAGKAKAADFSNLVSGDKEETEEQARQLRARLMEELAELAKEVEAGTSTKEEASRKFVGLVVQDRFGDNQGKGAKSMEDSIADMVEADPTFVNRLHAQLKKLSKS
jgi:hypothetical protein